MLNTDIFNFEFVDRQNEREMVDKFLMNSYESSGYALWLSGKRGTGKTFFLTQYVCTKEDFVSAYVNTDINNTSPGIYLKTFIAQLNKAANLKFSSYLRANYKSIATIGQKAINVALSFADLDDTGLDELGSSITNYFVSKHGEKENTVIVIKKYIAEALKKCDKMIFILDNFSLCDPSSLEVIVSALHALLDNGHLRFIICTTDDDLESRFDIKSILAEKIPNKQIVIYPFQQKQLFVRMLEHTFDLNESNIKLLAQAFELCQGIPQRFKEILINLYTDRGIIFHDNKAQFVMGIFQQILFKGEFTFDIESLCKKKKGVKTILHVIALWGVPILSSVLFDFLEFLADSDPFSILKNEVIEILQFLEELHIIIRSFENNSVLFQFEHDSLKLAVSEYFREDRFVPFLHFNIYEYLMIRIHDLKHPYWSRYYQGLLALHSFAAQADGWIECNFDYGSTFFEAGLFKEAGQIFSRLESVVALLSGEQLLTMGITLFHCGQYHKADDLLSNIQLRHLMRNFSTEQAVNLYIFQAKAQSCMLDSKRALNTIKQAENLIFNYERLRIITMGAKQSILFLTPNGFKEAKAIFDNLVEENLNIQEMVIVYQSAMDYYEGAQAQDLLNKGLSLATTFSNRIAEGKILNNMGFEHLRCGNYAEAHRCFEESISIIRDCQPHEQAYPFSNLAVLHMISGDWEQALDYIVESLFWNKSEYASLVLKTNRMLCYYFTGNSLWEKLYRELNDYIKSKYCVDDKIYKKICINMAVVASKDNSRISEAKDLLDQCYPHLANEWSHGKYRFFKLYEKVTGIKNVLTPPADSNQFQYYCGIEFEPWLLNFSHD